LIVAEVTFVVLLVEDEVVLLLDPQAASPAATAAVAKRALMRLLNTGSPWLMMTGVSAEPEDGVLLTCERRC
jgi:hypothetical protein